MSSGVSTMVAARMTATISASADSDRRPVT